jgi:hypothetical protein
MSRTAELAPTKWKESEWTVLRLAANGRASILDLAEANYTLRGGWKHVIERGREEAALRLDTDPQKCGAGDGPDFEPLLDGAGSVEPAPAAWLDGAARLIEESGWTSYRRDDRLAVPVDDYTAEAAPDGDGFAVFTMQVCQGRHKTPASRQAAALLLLRAGGAVRMASGFLVDDRAGFIARVPPAAGSDGIGDALHALTHCARYCAKEVSALGDERAAAPYLALGANPLGH